MQAHAHTLWMHAGAPHAPGKAIISSYASWGADELQGGAGPHAFVHELGSGRIRAAHVVGLHVSLGECCVVHVRRHIPHPVYVRQNLPRAWQRHSPVLISHCMPGQPPM